jgi:hypothetical protein
MGWLAGGAFILIGMFAMAAAIADWEPFMRSQKARLFVGVFGRRGARLVYVLIGLMLVGVGAAILVQL